MRQNENRYYRSSSFYTSAFLLAKGLELVNIDKTDSPRRAIFVFKDKPEREEYLHFYNFGKENHSELMIDARKLVMAIKTLKDQLYQERF